MQVPFVDLSRFFNKHKQNILKLTDAVGKSGIYILGEIVEKFEKDFAEFCGVKYAISVGNGTDALALSLKSLDISKGDEVIIPGNSFIATAGAVIEVGATPVCVDVKKDQNICINSINESISPKTKAIIVVHLNGKPVQIDAGIQRRWERDIDGFITQAEANWPELEAEPAASAAAAP